MLEADEARRWSVASTMCSTSSARRRGHAGKASPRPGPPGVSRAARAMLALLVDGQVLGPSRLAALTGPPAAAAGVAVVELELADFGRRLPGGVQAVALPLDG